MARNSFINIFKFTIFGESHDTPTIVDIVGGWAAGLKLNIEFIQVKLIKGKSGPSKITTHRKEGIVVEILYVIFEILTTCSPIGFVIKDQSKINELFSYSK